MLKYSKKMIYGFNNPKNIGVIDNADGIGKVGNPICGDVMEIFIKVGKRNGKEIIEDIKFRTFGCASAIATSSMITQLAKGKTLEEAKKISNKDIIEELEGLPNIKKHCSNLAEESFVCCN
jgi:nitrogen fixation NifU-like protein